LRRADPPSKDSYRLYDRYEWLIMNFKYDVISLEGSRKPTKGLRLIDVLTEIRIGHFHNKCQNRQRLRQLGQYQVKKDLYVRFVGAGLLTAIAIAPRRRIPDSCLVLLFVA
jgi:hypothetical protein